MAVQIVQALLDTFEAYAHMLLHQNAYTGVFTYLIL